MPLKKQGIISFIPFAALAVIQPALHVIVHFITDSIKITLVFPEKRSGIVVGIDRGKFFDY